MSAVRRASDRWVLVIALFVAFVLNGAASASAQQLAYVSAITDDTCSGPSPASGCTRGLISVVNLAANQLQTSIDVWRGVGRGRLQFRTILADPAGSRLFVVLTDTEASPSSQQRTIVRMFDTRSSSQISEILMPSIVSACAISRDGTRLFCGRAQPSDDIAVIDARTGVVLTAIPAAFPTALALSPSSDVLFVSRSDRQLAVYDSVTHALLRLAPLPAIALSMAVSGDGLHVYAGLNDRSVVDFDPATNTIAGTIADVALGSNLPSAATFAKDRAYVAARGGTGVYEGVTVIDVASRTIINRIPIANPQETAAAIDGSRVFVARELRGSGAGCRGPASD